MGRLFDGDAYAFHWLTIPYLVLIAGLIVILAYVLFTRGDPAMRASLLMVLGAAFVFIGGEAAAMSATDPRVAQQIYRIAVTPISLAGAAALALTLAIVGGLSRRRAMLGLAAVTTTITAILTLTTDGVVAGVWKTPVGVYYLVAGPLQPLHVGVMVAWFVVAVVVSIRGSRRARAEHRRAQGRRMVVAGVLALLASADALLSHRIGFMPVTWVALLVLVVLVLYTVFTGDLMRARGRDWSSGWEVAVTVVLGVLVFGVYVATADMRTGGVPLLTIIAIAALLGASQTAVAAVRRRQTRAAEHTDAALERAYDAFVDLCSDIQDETRLADAARVFLKYHVALGDGRLYVATDEGMLLVGLDEDEAPLVLPIDTRVKAWIVANRSPLLLDRLESRRLGGLRGPIEEFLERYDAEVVLPLVDRDNLVGLFVAGVRERKHALTDQEADILAKVQDVTTRTLTYMQLYRDAEQRVEVAREVEIAAAVQHARVKGKAEVAAAGCSIESYYLPAGQFGGDWWMHAELSDGRLLLVIGDVTGHGVPAALVTATAEGSCETAIAMLGGGFEVYDMLQLLNRSVLDVGRSRYLMSCFAAVIDRSARTITFANAGHPFPYLCRKPANGAGRSELRGLVSRGTPLGFEQEPLLSVSHQDLESEDILVFYTDALVESESEQGKRYGDRRLQRALRTLAHRAGDRVCDEIMEDARAYYGTHPIREDITLVCVRIGPL